MTAAATGLSGLVYAAQNALFRKLLRIDPKAGGRPEVLHGGPRNPYRFSFDRNGDLHIG